MDEIQSLGVMSDFGEYKDKIEQFPEEELLIVGDKQQIFGELFLLCVTLEGKELMYDQMMASQREEEERLKRIQEEEERVRREELAYLEAVFDDTPLTPQPWTESSSSRATQHAALNRVTFRAALRRPARSAPAAASPPLS